MLCFKQNMDGKGLEKTAATNIIKSSKNIHDILLPCAKLQSLRAQEIDERKIDSMVIKNLEALACEIEMMNRGGAEEIEFVLVHDFLDPSFLYRDTIYERVVENAKLAGYTVDSSCKKMYKMTVSWKM